LIETCFVPQLFSTSRDEAAIYRYPPLFHIAIVVVAVVLQAYLPLLIRSASLLDLPLLVVAYIALTSRSQPIAMVTGAVTGMLQDSLAYYALGVNGIAKTVSGYLAASLGIRIDADHPGVRLLLVFCLYWIDALIVVGIKRYLLATTPALNWPTVALAALANGIVAMFLFRLFDRFRWAA
jgi:rod shape-determining protein MreD